MSTAGGSGRQHPSASVGRPFQPGQSGNPSGRSKVLAEVDALIKREWAPRAPEVLARLFEIATTAAPRDAVPAAREYLDRTVGKAKNMPEPRPLTEADASPVTAAELRTEALRVARRELASFAAAMGDRALTPEESATVIGYLRALQPERPEDMSEEELRRVLAEYAAGKP